ncbi:hypothetical protein QR680_002893 [Steinernema hermaphroditum]|uniref:Uncharacterized protein n=1 Tax=Steinernema hermaphroditum TaxID=289476 RepID=A0AA39H744_9BILA|nr:hypothetical protein QR680_002893 [Steinernema hermaphroditum]
MACSTHLVDQDVDSLGTHFASVRFKHTTFRLSSPKHQIRWNSSSTLKLQLRSGFSQYRLVEEECNKDGFLNGSDQAIDFATQLIRCRNWQGLRAIMTEKCLEVSVSFINVSGTPIAKMSASKLAAHRDKIIVANAMSPEIYDLLARGLSRISTPLISRMIEDYLFRLLELLGCGGRDTQS